jgi:hypothetical protein
MRFITRKSLTLLAVFAGLSLLVLAACGGDDDDNRTILTPTTGDFSPTVISSDIAVGENRFVIGLLDADGLPVANATLAAEFLRVEADGSTTSTAEVNLAAITVERSFTHLHEDGENHRHDAGELGVYITNVEFETAGQWQVVT